MNHTGFFLQKHPGAHFVRAAEKQQFHEPFEKQTVHCTLDCQLYVKTKHECMTVKAKGRWDASSYQKENCQYVNSDRVKG